MEYNTARETITPETISGNLDKKINFLRSKSL
jgi:hypothetical protein